MTSRQKIKVSIKTDSDIPTALRNELKNLDKITRLEKSLRHLLSSSNFYEVTQDRFKEDVELLFTVAISDELIPLIKKMEDGCKSLGEICDGHITEGDTIRREEKYVIESEEYEKLPESEKLGYNKAIKGVNVREYVVKWEGLYIRSFSEVSPETRILIKDYSRKPTVAWELEKYRCLRTVYCAYLRDPHLEPKYILAVLNSSLLWFYFLAYFYTSRPGKGSFRFRTQFLNRLPIKYANSEAQNQIATEVEKIMMSENDVLNLKDKVLNFPEPYLKINEHLTSLANVVKARHLSKSSYAISEKSLRTDYLMKDLDGRETFRIILAPKEYVDFHSEQIASFVFEILKTRKRVTKQEVLETKIPSQEYLEKLMYQYKMDKEKIAKNQKAIKELKKQVDKLVYKIYGITHRERRIIEGYLARFW